MTEFNFQPQPSQAISHVHMTRKAVESAARPAKKNSKVKQSARKVSEPLKLEIL
jgi:hypothetical protein